MQASIHPELTWLLSAAACCLATELLLRLPIASPVRSILSLGARASHVVASRRISEHWKERASQAYAWRMGGSTLLLAFWMVAFLGAVAALLVAMEFVRPGVVPLLESWPGIALAVGVSLAYIWIRQSRVR